MDNPKNSIISPSSFKPLYQIERGEESMSKKEALQIGKIIADRWWHHNESTILAKQNIERRKAWEQKKLTTPASN
ncbi:hypothetical protein AUF15_08350 [Enterococcus avium]|nr:hypothetical protein AUF15_08350 [Enterococcus avium]